MCVGGGGGGGARGGGWSVGAGWALASQFGTDASSIAKHTLNNVLEILHTDARFTVFS